MHSIIFTRLQSFVVSQAGQGVKNLARLARISVAALLSLPLATAALADPTYGCFARNYSAAHLAKHPAQVVDTMRLNLLKQKTYGEWIGLMDVQTANQGHVRRSGLGGQGFSQFLICWENAGKRSCGVECDGGTFDIIRDDGKVLDIRTRYLMVGNTDGCGGSVDLAEVNYSWVTYRLYRVPDAACNGM